MSNPYQPPREPQPGVNWMVVIGLASTLLLCAVMLLKLILNSKL